MVKNIVFLSEEILVRNLGIICQDRLKLSIDRIQYLDELLVQLLEDNAIGSEIINTLGRHQTKILYETFQKISLTRINNLARRLKTNFITDRKLHTKNLFDNVIKELVNYSNRFCDRFSLYDNEKCVKMYLIECDKENYLSVKFNDD